MNPDLFSQVGTGAPAPSPPAGAALPGPAAFSLRDMITEIETEIGMRRAVYARRVETGKMHPGTAERKVAVMEAIRRALVRLEGDQDYLRACLKWKADLVPCIDVLEGRG